MPSAPVFPPTPLPSVPSKLCTTTLLSWLPNPLKLGACAPDARTHTVSVTKALTILFSAAGLRERQPGRGRRVGAAVRRARLRAAGRAVVQQEPRPVRGADRGAQRRAAHRRPGHQVRILPLWTLTHRYVIVTSPVTERSLGVVAFRQNMLPAVRSRKANSSAFLLLNGRISVLLRFPVSSGEEK